MRYAIRWLVYLITRCVLSLRYRVRVVGLEQLRGLDGQGQGAGAAQPPRLHRPAPRPDRDRAGPRPSAPGVRGDLQQPLPVAVHEDHRRRARARPGKRLRQRPRGRPGLRAAIIDGLKAGGTTSSGRGPAAARRRRGARRGPGAGRHPAGRARCPGRPRPHARPVGQHVLLRLHGRAAVALRAAVRRAVGAVDQPALPRPGERDHHHRRGAGPVEAAGAAPREGERLLRGVVQRRGPGRRRPTVPYHFLFGPRTFDFPHCGSRWTTSTSRKVQPGDAARSSAMLADKIRPAAGRRGAEAGDDARPDRAWTAWTAWSSPCRSSSGSASPASQCRATVGQLWALAAGLVEKEPPKPPPGVVPAAERQALPRCWATRSPRRSWPAPGIAQDVAVADDLAGVLTYERLLVGALLMRAAGCGRLAAPNVGLLLPASVGGRHGVLRPCTWPASCRWCSTGRPARPTWPTPPRHGPDARRHLARVHRPARHQDRGRGVPLPRRPARGHRRFELLRRCCSRFAAWFIRPGAARVPQARSRTRRPWCCSPAARRRRPRPCR